VALASERGSGYEMTMNPRLLLLSAMSGLACSRGHFATPAESKPVIPADAGDTAPLVATTPPPVACSNLTITTLADVETKFIGPRCSVLPPGVTGGSCHSTEFPPRGLDMPGTIRGTLVDQLAQGSCKTDKYINSADITKSFILAKVLAPTDTVDCPSGPAAAGMFRMPDQAVNPKPALLSGDERECFRWYVTELTKQP
jgi:hypothetical protein